MIRAALCLLLLASPAGAGFWWGSMSDPLAGTRALFARQKYDEVIAALSPESLQKLKKEPLAQAYLMLGLSYQNTGHLGQALSTYQIASKLFPKDINILSELGTLLHRSSLDEQAEPVFQKVLAVHPNNSRAHLGLAEIDRSLGLTDESADHYEIALEAMSDQAPLWRDYAEVLIDRRDYKTAAAALAKSLALAADPDSLVDRAKIERATGRLPDAIGSLDEALKLRPDDHGIRLLRGLWYLEAGRVAQAKAAATAALKLDSADPLARWIDARAALIEGRRADAIKDLKIAAVGERQARFVAEAAAALLTKLEEKH
jgi:tetratricopeptide (TPR) repeat protein